MSKVAVIAAQGCEEGETLTIVDIFRRAELDCELVGLGSREIEGAHHISFCCDAEFDGSLDAYDMVVLPGGYGGTEAMLENKKLIAALQDADAAGTWLCAICAAPQVLGRAGLLKGKKYCCYPSVADKVEDSGIWVDAPVVIGGRIITGQGPALAYAFAYELVSLLGADAEAVKNRMIYYNAFEVEGGIPSWDTEAGHWPAPEDISPTHEPLAVQKVAVLMPEGCEEGETVQIIDLLLRAGIQCESFATGKSVWVSTMQGMTVRADHLFSAQAIASYDALVVPGGRSAAAPLIANDEVMTVLRDFHKKGKLIGGLCSGTTVLEAAGVLAGKLATGYTGYGAKLKSALFVANQVVVWDGNIVTSQGPCAPYPFAFQFMEAAGIKTQALQERLLYDKAGGRLS